MSGRIILRLVGHVLVLASLAAFFATFPALLPGLVRFDLYMKSCSIRLANCLAIAGLWDIILGCVLALVLDIRMLMQSEGRAGRLWGSLALELLLAPGWYAVLSSMAGSDVIGPAWLMVPGPAIMLSAIASAVVAWLQLRGSLAGALSAAGVWMERVTAVVLTLIAGVLTYLFAD